MMPVFTGLVVAAVLAGLGYVVLWAAGRQDTPKGLGTFGRILAIVLFCIAGLTLLAGLVAAPMMAFGGPGPLGRGAGGPCGPGCLGHGKQKEIRIERRVCPGDEGPCEQSDAMSDDEDREFEDEVREIVADMLHDEMFTRRVLEVVKAATPGK